jgi:UDPglucose--hexose-1-phosphate uridylyltransferase
MAMAIEFRCESLLSRFQNPGEEAYSERKLQVRFDPLLGTSARIAEGVKLQTSVDAARVSIRALDMNCPFCAERIDKVTPRIAAEITPAGRIRVGDTVLFPNLVPYSKYATVAVFTTRHWLDLRDFTPALIVDNLAASLEYIRAVTKVDADARFCAYNINYLYPSGGSLPHPHSQLYVDPFPTSMMRMQHASVTAYWQANGRCFWNDLVSEETQRAERMIARDGPIVWMTPFAPIGFNEVRAVLCERTTILDLSSADVQELASGISRVLAWYDSIGYNSFNLALYSGELGKDGADRVNLTMLTRTAMTPFYRSDSMYLERLHWEAALDRTPEDVATDVREYFRSKGGA